MNKNEETIKITLSDDTFTELKIMAMRSRIDVRSFISDVLDKYIDKKRDKLVTA